MFVLITWKGIELKEKYIYVKKKRTNTRGLRWGLCVCCVQARFSPAFSGSRLWRHETVKLFPLLRPAASNRWCCVYNGWNRPLRRSLFKLAVAFKDGKAQMAKASNCVSLELFLLSVAILVESSASGKLFVFLRGMCFPELNLWSLK